MTYSVRNNRSSEVCPSFGGPIGIVQVGIGHNHGAAKMATLRKMPERFKVLGFVEDDDRLLAERSNQPAYGGLCRYTFEEALELPGLEAVAVETVVASLVPAALRCAEAGLHVHMDKPGGEDLSQ